MEKVRPWCGQPSDRGRLRNRTEPSCHVINSVCQSAEQNTKHWPQPVAWPFRFFIHHWPPNGGYWSLCAVSPMLLPFPKAVLVEVGWHSNVLIGFSSHVCLFISLLVSCLHQLAKDLSGSGDVSARSTCCGLMSVELLSAESRLRHHKRCKEERTALGSSSEWADCAWRFVLWLS